MGLLLFFHFFLPSPLQLTPTQHHPHLLPLSLLVECLFFSSSPSHLRSIAMLSKLNTLYDKLSAHVSTLCSTQRPLLSAAIGLVIVTGRLIFGHSKNLRSLLFYFLVSCDIDCVSPPPPPQPHSILYKHHQAKRAKNKNMALEQSHKYVFF
jgi:hypothetical protein